LQKKFDTEKEWKENELSPIRVALFFDEAQLLLKKDGFAFHCIRWWLRTKNYFCNRPLEVVAVFAGTDLKLANIFPYDPPETQNDRQNLRYYWNDKIYHPHVYPPFFHICSIGCYHAVPVLQNITDFGKSAFYGRPLFAHLQKNGQLLKGEEYVGETLSNPILHSILKSASKWQESDGAIFSILGTCVPLLQLHLI
jgi:hypothetical protein